MSDHPGSSLHLDLREHPDLHEGGDEGLGEGDVGLPAQLARHLRHLAAEAVPDPRHGLGRDVEIVDIVEVVDIWPPCPTRG